MKKISIQIGNQKLEIIPKRINIFVGNTESGKYELMNLFTKLFIKDTDKIVLVNPENDMYPPDIVNYGDNLSKQNNKQFYITTNSPYLVSSLLDFNKNKDVSLCIVFMKNYKIKLKLLNDDELYEVAELDCDFFFNLEKFI